MDNPKRNIRTDRNKADKVNREDLTNLDIDDSKSTGSTETGLKTFGDKVDMRREDEADGSEPGTGD